MYSTWNRLSSLFVNLKAGILSSAYVDRLKAKETLKKQHSEHWTAVLGM
jgi:hypothetical protein